MVGTKGSMLASWEHGVLVARGSTLYFSPFPSCCQALRWPSLPGILDSVTLKQESVPGIRLAPALESELLGWDNQLLAQPLPWYWTRLFFVPQSSPYHACHQLILPEGESGAHLRAGTRGSSAQGGGAGERKGRKGRPSNLCVPQTGHLWDSSFPTTPSDCSGEKGQEGS